MNRLFRNLISSSEQVFYLTASRDAMIDVDVLRRLLNVDTGEIFTPPDNVLFNLASDQEYSLQTTYIEHGPERTILWQGQASDNAAITAFLSVAGIDDTDSLSVAGHFVVGDQIYTLLPGEKGRVSIQLFDASYLKCCEPPVLQQAPLTETLNTGLSDSDSNSESVIDVIALCPPGIMKSFSEEAISALLGNMQQTANQVFKNSAINARVRILKYEVVSQFNYTSVVDLLRKDVVAVDAGEGQTFTRGPCWMTVTRKRNLAQADIVLILGDKDIETQAYGIASSIPEPARYDYSDLPVATLAVAITGGNPGMTFAHELGHLLGGKHSPAEQSTRHNYSPMYDFAHAYVAPDKTYATIMGSEEDAKGIILLPAYSSAGQTLAGKVLRIAIDQPQAADSASLFRRTAPVLSEYRGNGETDRPHMLTLSVSPPVGGTILPSELGPYPHGAGVQVRAIPRAGHQFVSWELDGKVIFAEPTMVLIMDSGHTLKAEFKAVS